MKFTDFIDGNGETAFKLIAESLDKYITVIDEAEVRAQKLLEERVEDENIYARIHALQDTAVLARECIQKIFNAQSFLVKYYPILLHFGQKDDIVEDEEDDSPGKLQSPQKDSKEKGFLKGLL